MSAVLDQVAVSTDTYTPAVGAQWMGQARDIRRRIAAEDTQYDRLVAALVAPVKDRLHRFPHRSLRQQMLVDLVHRWRFMAPRDWRLDLDAKLDKACATLIEHRLVAGVMRRKAIPTGRHRGRPRIIRVECRSIAAAPIWKAIASRPSLCMPSPAVCDGTLTALSRA